MEFSLINMNVKTKIKFKLKEVSRQVFNVWKLRIKLTRILLFYCQFLRYFLLILMFQNTQRKGEAKEEVIKLLL